MTRQATARAALLRVAAAAAVAPLPASRRQPSRPGLRARPRSPATQARAGSADPLGGKFSLADATQGLEGSRPLMAQIRPKLQPANPRRET